MKTIDLIKFICTNIQTALNSGGKNHTIMVSSGARHSSAILPSIPPVNGSAPKPNLWFVGIYVDGVCAVSNSVGFKDGLPENTDMVEEQIARQVLLTTFTTGLLSSWEEAIAKQTNLIIPK